MRAAPQRCAVLAGALLAGAVLAGSGGAAPMTGATPPAMSAAQRPHGGDDPDANRRFPDKEVAGRGRSRATVPPASLHQPPAPLASQPSHGSVAPRPGASLTSANAVRLRSLLAAKASPHLPPRAAAIRAAGGIGLVRSAMPIAGKTGVGKSGTGKSVAARLPGVASGARAVASAASGPRSAGVVALGGAVAGRATHAAVVDGSRMHRHPG